MEVVYTNEGIPVALINGTAYLFNSENAQVIVGELIIDESLSSDIKNNVINYINNVIEENRVGENSTTDDLRLFLRKLAAITYLGIVADIVDDADNTRAMLTTYKPFNSWRWEKDTQSWVPPHNAPEEAPEGIYVWNEDIIGWVPAKEKPFESWVWNDVLMDYIAPVPYPVDAEPDEFHWDEGKLIWIVNE